MTTTESGPLGALRAALAGYDASPNTLTARIAWSDRIVDEARKIEALATPGASVVDEGLRFAGQRLSCIAFNLAQEGRLSRADRNTLAEAYKRWDAALAATPAPVAPLATLTDDGTKAGKPATTGFEASENTPAPVAVESAKRWPFVESPGEFTARLQEAMSHFSLLGSVRHVLIENPPTLSPAPQAAAQVTDAMVERFKAGFDGSFATYDERIRSALTAALRPNASTETAP